MCLSQIISKLVSRQTLLQEGMPPVPVRPASSDTRVCLLAGLQEEEEAAAASGKEAQRRRGKAAAATAAADNPAAAVAATATAAADGQAAAAATTADSTAAADAEPAVAEAALLLASQQAPRSLPAATAAAVSARQPQVRHLPEGSTGQGNQDAEPNVQPWMLCPITGVSALIFVHIFLHVPASFKCATASFCTLHYSLWRA